MPFSFSTHFFACETSLNSSEGPGQWHAPKMQLPAGWAWTKLRTTSMQEGVKKKHCVFFFFLPAYSVIDLSMISVAFLQGWQAGGSVPWPLSSSMSLLRIERRASCSHGRSQSIARQLTMAGNFRAGALSMHPPGRNTEWSAGRREEEREKGITRRVEAFKERHAVNRSPAPVQASSQLRLRTNLAANKFSQLAFYLGQIGIYSFSTVRTLHTYRFCPVSPPGDSRSVYCL